MAQILNGYYDVTQNYSGGSGADPTGSTDATVAIQHYIDTASAAGGGVVWFPPGTYLVADGTALTLKSNVELRSPSNASSILVNNSGTTANTMITAVSAATNIAIRNLGFSGNTINASPPAPPVISLSGSSWVRIQNCAFTKNTGPTISLSNVTDCSITGCSFTNVGYANPSQSGSSYRTDAIASDTSCSGLRIIDNYINGCKFGGIWVRGNAIVSRNVLLNTVTNAILAQGANITLAFNGINTVSYQYQYTPVYAIQADGTQSVSIMGNQVMNSDGDGVALTSGFYDAVVYGNNCGNCGLESSHGTGDSALYTFSTSSANAGLVLLGNNCWTGSGQSPTPNGLHITYDGTSGGFITSGNAVANNVYGNITTPILADASVTNDSMAIVANSAWLDRQHTAGYQKNSTTNSEVTPNVPSVPAGSMRQTNGVRIVAGGCTVGVKGSRTITLQFGGNTILTASQGTWTPQNSTSSWSIVATIMNLGSESSQCGAVYLYADGKYVHAGAVDFVSTADPIPIALSTQNASNGDVIYVDFVSVERC